MGQRHESATWGISTAPMPGLVCRWGLRVSGPSGPGAAGCPPGGLGASAPPGALEAQPLPPLAQGGWESGHPDIQALVPPEAGRLS